MRGAVLIVDRDSELVSILSSYLKVAGYRVVFTNRVREALRKLGNQRFEHIFIDPELAPENALNILDELAIGSSMNHKTPVTLMSFDLNYALPLVQARRLNAILPKPFALGEFSLLLQGASGGS